MAENTKKSLVEEALLQMRNLEEAVTENAKGILASTMKEEISELVKESLSEEDEMVDTEVEMGDVTEQDVDVDMEDEEEVEMEPEMGDMDSDEDSEMEDDELGGLDMGDMLGMDLPGGELEVDDEEEVLLPLDLTGASDDEILKVFKAMGDEDGIIVKKDGDEIHLNDEEENVEYIIQTESEDEELELDMTSEMMDVEEGDDDVVYEIEIGEEDDEEDTEMVDEGWNEEEVEEGYNADLDDSLGMKDHGKKMKQSFADRRKESEGMEKAMGNRKYSGDKSMGYMNDAETTEAAHTLGNGSRNDASKKSLPKMKVKPVNESELKTEVTSLRAKNEEYRKALNIFREKLNEVAVFNSNLAYATRLFTEHSTTKQEKINILRRFDSVETLKESKALYKTLKEDYEGKETVVKESVESKVQKSPSKGSATNLIESKTYENPQFLRMKYIMSKIIK